MVPMLRLIIDPHQIQRNTITGPPKETSTLTQAKREIENTTTITTHEDTALKTQITITTDTIVDIS